MNQDWEFEPLEVVAKKPVEELSKADIHDLYMKIDHAVERGKSNPKKGVPVNVRVEGGVDKLSDIQICLLFKSLWKRFMDCKASYVYVGIGQNKNDRPGDHQRDNEFDKDGYIFALNVGSQDRARRIEDYLGGEWEQYLGFKFNDHLPSSDSKGEGPGTEETTYVYIGYLSKKERDIVDKS